MRCSAAKREAKAAFGKDEVYLEKLVQPRAPRRGADPGRHPRQPRPPVRARLLDPAPPPEGDRARAGPLSRRRRSAPPCARRRSKIGRATELCRRRHGRVPDGCRHRRLLLHRGQSAHPGRAHGDRGRHRPRHREGADPDRRGRPHRPARRRPASRHRTRSGSTAMPCSAGSPPRTPRTTSSPTMAASPPIAAPSASASASTAAPPIPAPWSPATTTRCWRR